jgi:hypothetical protein
MRINHDAGAIRLVSATPLRNCRRFGPKGRTKTLLQSLVIKILNGGSIYYSVMIQEEGRARPILGVMIRRGYSICMHEAPPPVQALCRPSPYGFGLPR